MFLINSELIEPWRLHLAPYTRFRLVYTIVIKSYTRQDAAPLSYYSNPLGAISPLYTYIIFSKILNFLGKFDSTLIHLNTETLRI